MNLSPRGRDWTRPSPSGWVDLGGRGQGSRVGADLGQGLQGRQTQSGRGVWGDAPFSGKEGKREGEEHQFERQTSLSCSHTRPAQEEAQTQACALSGIQLVTLSLCGSRPIKWLLSLHPSLEEQSSKEGSGLAGRASGPVGTRRSQRQGKTLALHRASGAPSPCLTPTRGEWEVKRWRGLSRERHVSSSPPPGLGEGQSKCGEGGGAVGPACGALALCREMGAHGPITGSRRVASHSGPSALTFWG